MLQTLKLFLIFAFINLSECGNCNSDAQPSSNIEVNLRNHIFCKYDKSERPKVNISLELSYGVRGFNFDEGKSLLKIESRILHRWTDLRLMWDENNFAGIRMFHVSSDDLWMPRLFLNNSRHHYGLGSCHPTECIVKSSGEASCWIPCEQIAACDADFYDWPFDKHDCHLVFRTFSTYENVQFDAEALNGILLRDSTNEWKLLSVDGHINITDPTNIKFIFKLQRYPDMHYSHVYVPAYMLMTLTVLILLTTNESSWRLILSGLNIYLHISLMDRVWWQFPLNGVARSAPRVLKFMSLMLIFAAFVLVKSIILRMLITRFPEPPLWMQKFSLFIKNNICTKYLIISLDFFQIDEKVDDTKQAWTVFCRFIERLLIIFFILSFTLYNNI